MIKSEMNKMSFSQRVAWVWGAAVQAQGNPQLAGTA